MGFRACYFLTIIQLTVNLLSGATGGSHQTTEPGVPDTNEWDGSETHDTLYTLHSIEILSTIGKSKFRLNAHDELGCDIDASATKTWNDCAGFIPVGFR